MNLMREWLAWLWCETLLGGQVLLVAAFVLGTAWLIAQLVFLLMRGA